MKLNYNKDVGNNAIEIIAGFVVDLLVTKLIIKLALICRCVRLMIIWWEVKNEENSSNFGHLAF